MQIKEIHYNSEFVKQFSSLPKNIQKKAYEKEALFRKNLFHPSLRLHKLKGKLQGLWSISIDMKYRIIFKPLENGVILFISVGVHAIYE
ncbi:MAG: plasmid stabilization system protein [Candidatus Peregrinibacteria bacterium GW2011_GWF2_38_29]|nr:MAG: plasmid stabilization system protein [Candidatus Peregrinibacteria bacterium GW2011_GWF2_38_29]HBB03219.1 type II toxin-antitoxin system mRNA interferase toxin, RelE/StbE family [Candidatus Peregrinibacteria bacterium]